MRTMDTEIRKTSFSNRLRKKIKPPEIDPNWHMTQIVNNSLVVSVLLWLLAPSSLQCLVLGDL